MPEDLLTPRPDPAPDGTPMTVVTQVLEQCYHLLDRPICACCPTGSVHTIAVSVGPADEIPAFTGFSQDKCVICGIERPNRSQARVRGTYPSIIEMFTPAPGVAGKMKPSRDSSLVASGPPALGRLLFLEGSSRHVD